MRIDDNFREVDIGADHVKSANQRTLHHEEISPPLDDRKASRLQYGGEKFAVNGSEHSHGLD